MVDTPALPLQYAERLDELAALGDGWFDGFQGERLTGVALGVARQVLRRAAVRGLPRVGVFPTLEAGVAIELVGEGEFFRSVTIAGGGVMERFVFGGSQDLPDTRDVGVVVDFLVQREGFGF